MKRRVLLALISVLLVMMLFVGCTTIESKTTAKPTVNNYTETNLSEEITFELNHTEYSMAVGQQFELSADKTGLDITWSTSNDKIAKVEDGKVTAINEGTAVVKATVQDVERECRIFVSGVEMPSRIHLEAPSIAMIGKPVKLNLFYDFKKVESGLEWQVSSDSIATIDANGNLNAISQGTVEVTATYTRSSAEFYTETCSIDIVAFRSIKFLERKSPI